MIIVMMGVCGSGKTTIGSELAKQVGCSFADADEFHSAENKRKMSQGIPLTDEDRYPWLVSIHHYMQRLHSTGEHGVVTCSALKRQYRDILRDGIQEGAQTNASSSSQELKTSQAKVSSQEDNIAPDQEMPSNISNMSPRITSNSRLALKFVHLTGSADVLQKRMECRLGHFMPPELLKSQLETLEPFHTDEDYLVTDIDRPVEDIVAEILMKLKLCSSTSE